MPSKQNGRATVLDRVTTPLGFFTLGILVIEAILAALSLRASHGDLTILIVGMLAGFALLCVMVFVLAAHPRLRYALSGEPDFSPANAIRELGLTKNDIRFIHTFRRNYHSSDVEYAMLGDKPLPMSGRIEKLRKLGLVQSASSTLKANGADFMLTSEGRALADLIELFASAVIELNDSHPIEK